VKPTHESHNRQPGRPETPASPHPRQQPEDPRSEESEFFDEPDLPPGEPSGAPTRKNRVGGDEPMTGAQRSYLKGLCEQARQPFDEDLTKAQASERIDELHRLTRHPTGPSESEGKGGAPH
jgi:hypothetical protein